MTDETYIEVGDDGRFYRVLMVDGPIVYAGVTARSLLDHDEQELLIDRSVSPRERAVLIERASSLRIVAVPMIASS
jgi:hypothetical protein